MSDGERGEGGDTEVYEEIKGFYVRFSFYTVPRCSCFRYLSLYASCFEYIVKIQALIKLYRVHGSRICVSLEVAKKKLVSSSRRSFRYAICGGEMCTSGLLGVNFTTF